MLVWKLSLPSQAAVHPHRIFFFLGLALIAVSLLLFSLKL